MGIIIGFNAITLVFTFWFDDVFIKGFCCKKSGYFTKPVKNITNWVIYMHKPVNNDTKSNSYSLKRQ